MIKAKVSSTGVLIYCQSTVSRSQVNTAKAMLAVPMQVVNDDEVDVVLGFESATFCTKIKDVDTGCVVNVNGRLGKFATIS